MMVRAEVVIERAEKFMRLRRGHGSKDGNVDRTWELATICKKFSDKLYARGNSITECEYSA